MKTQSRDNFSDPEWHKEPDAMPSGWWVGPLCNGGHRPARLYSHKHSSNAIPFAGGFTGDFLGDVEGSIRGSLAKEGGEIGGVGGDKRGDKLAKMQSVPPYLAGNFSTNLNRIGAGQ